MSVDCKAIPKSFWDLKVKEHLENSNIFLNAMSKEEKFNKAQQYLKDMKEIDQIIESTSKEELAKLIYLLKKEIEDKTRYIEDNENKLESIDKIQEIICNTYGLGEDD